MINELQENFKKLLAKNNLTYGDVAEKSELPVDTIKNIYYGKADARASTLTQICKATGFDANELLGVIDNNNNIQRLVDYYKESGNHGKMAILEYAKFQHSCTDYENKQTHEHAVVCIEPTGNFQNGILWDSCRLSLVTTYLPNIYFAFKIPTHAFHPTYAYDDILMLEHRYPDENEKAILYKNNMVYLRRIMYSKQTGIFTLKAVSMDSKDINVPSLEGFELLGTIISPDRRTIRNETPLDDIPISLNIDQFEELLKKDFSDRIKEPQ